MKTITKKLLTIGLLLSTSLAFTSCEMGKKNENSLSGEEAILESLQKAGKDINNKNNKEIMKIDQLAKPVAGDMIATFETSMGDIKIKLFSNVTKKTVENFKGLAEKGYYNGTIFHRVIKDFMIQGGDPDGTGMGGDSFFGGNFEDEFNTDLKNIKGALSMANRGPNTNGSQFFIVQAEATPWLDGKHTVFGQVFEGMDLVDKIAVVETLAMDKPATEITVKSIKIEVLK